MQRYLALDAFRGLTIALMILVITPGSWSHVYPPLLHAEWHGWTPTDLVFPFFMFIIGVAMYFSFSKQNFQLNTVSIIKILRRSLIIFLLGLALNAFPTYESFDSLRIMSVLGRIGLAYALAAILVLLLKPTGIRILSIILLVAYWLILQSVGDGAYTLETNLVRQVDLMLLGEGHMWQGKGIPFDPEGILSTLPSLVSIFIGFEVGRLVATSSEKSQVVKYLLIWGVAAFALGYLWSIVMPINKYLWTSSYVLVTSAVALWVLALFIWFVDIQGYHASVRPLVVYGMNPLFIYVFAAVWTDCYRLVDMSLPSGGTGMLREWLFQHMSHIFTPINASLVYALIHVFIFWLVCLFLYRKNIVIKI
ncbi:DUF5009 domain-containing protein [Teredinibacter sp. KSP-S5-2]|uniref:acyltransferase family protein n=1 Tax=Teredinibacter sp. KSP-S5-2 TaxID=3034506 RepID=UPI002934F963|nr:DUF5009 domain-containing protein [Teredinibacter sp. KSP-S5-2]WNO11160.1 DUF5009 domain-containing protein [Teredinibacter sp. KSP-S5-2]